MLPFLLMRFPVLFLNNLVAEFAPHLVFVEESASKLRRFQACSSVISEQCKRASEHFSGTYFYAFWEE